MFDVTIPTKQLAVFLTEHLTGHQILTEFCISIIVKFYTKVINSDASIPYFRLQVGTNIP